MPLLPLLVTLALQPISQTWYGYGGNPHHTAQSNVATRAFDKIVWKTKVDQNPRYSGNDLLAHYGEPSITANNTVVIPVKRGFDDNFKVEGRLGLNGRLLWTIISAYTLPPHGWVPSFGPTLTTDNRVAIPDSGGRVTFRSKPDEATGEIKTVCFYGDAEFAKAKATYEANVKICTPITTGLDGSVYFGYQVLGDTPLKLESGLAKIRPDGTAIYRSAASLAGDSSYRIVKQNCAPMISIGSGIVVYVTVATGNYGRGKLLGLRTSDLSRRYSTDLFDPKSNQPATIDSDGTSSPVQGPDGDVYYGVLANSDGNNGYRGWLLHFSGDLTKQKTSGAFGWDNTPTIVPRSLFPRYQGNSRYLLFTKYNNYAGGGGDGANRIALLDPNEAALESRSQIMTMKEIATQLGPTRDLNFPNHPAAVREWCINSGAIDIPGKSIIANCEDGILYRWDLVTNTLSEKIRLTDGIGEAYTPTLIGPDGKVYAINNAMLYAIGSKPR